jgi:hypothetical protein
MALKWHSIERWLFLRVCYQKKGVAFSAHVVNEDTPNHQWFYLSVFVIESW